jgi:hypothetical protein
VPNNKSGFHRLFKRRQNKQVALQKRRWHPDLNAALTTDCTSTLFLHYTATAMHDERHFSIMEYVSQPTQVGKQMFLPACKILPNKNVPVAATHLSCRNSGISRGVRAHQRELVSLQ